MRKQSQKEYLRVKSPARDELLGALAAMRVSDFSALAFVLLLLLEELSQVRAPK